MGKHILGVDVIPTNNNQILHLFDTSHYSEDLQVTCKNLEITIPGFKRPRLFEPPQHFNLSLNGILLNLISEEATVLPPLPDGIYTIRYSVSPNDRVYVTIKHLRTTVIAEKVAVQRCKLDISTCLPTEELKDKLKQLNEIDDYIDAAVASLEVCDEDEDKAITLITYANKLVERYSKNC